MSHTIILILFSSRFRAPFYPLPVLVWNPLHRESHQCDFARPKRSPLVNEPFFPNLPDSGTLRERIMTAAICHYYCAGHFSHVVSHLLNHPTRHEEWFPFQRWGTKLREVMLPLWGCVAGRQQELASNSLTLSQVTKTKLRAWSDLVPKVTHNAMNKSQTLSDGVIVHTHGQFLEEEEEEDANISQSNYWSQEARITSWFAK